MTDAEFKELFHIVNAPQDCSATHKTVQDKKTKLQDIP